MYAGTRSQTSRLRLVITSESLTAHRVSWARLGRESDVVTAAMVSASRSGLGGRSAAPARRLVLALRCVAGDREEDVVERGAVQGQPTGIHTGGVEAPHRLHQRL